MTQEITAGLRNTESQPVQPEDTAKRYGSGMLEVLATPAMIAFMEYTCLQCVQPYLPEGHGTVGTSVDIRHLKATPVGHQVTCHCELTEADGNKLTFRVEAEDEDGPIGNGTHKRFIINEERFLKRIYPGHA